MQISSIITDIAPLYQGPDTESGRIDEALYGMSVQILQQTENGWCYIQTEHKTEGYTPLACLELRADVAGAWRKYKKSIVLAPYIDAQRQAKTGAARVASIPRGGLVVPLGEADAAGWQKIGLPTGEIGFTRASYIGSVIYDWAQIKEEDMRWNLVETALSYNGGAYRSGGRTPLGIDAVGLVTMSYQLNGITLPRETFFKQGGILQQIDIKKIDEGDILYFPESMGIFIGNNQFIHATTAPGVEGVIVNSLRPKDDNYAAELASHVVAVASIY